VGHGGHSSWDKNAGKNIMEKTTGNHQTEITESISGRKRNPETHEIRESQKGIHRGDSWLSSIFNRREELNVG